MVLEGASGFPVAVQRETPPVGSLAAAFTRALRVEDARKRAYVRLAHPTGRRGWPEQVRP